MSRRDPFLRPRSAAQPVELDAPVEWRTDELEALRQRVRALTAQGYPRSTASVAAFHELVARRALERARSEARPGVPRGDPS
jgi:hypothetical protein